MFPAIVERELYDALALWGRRDPAVAQPGVRGAANTAVAAIDEMTRALHALRDALVLQVREYDDAAGTRTDALLAELRARRAATL